MIVMFWVILTAVAVMAIACLFRLRTGGPGPGVAWVPRRYRSRLNNSYRSKGWQAPYDAEGNRDDTRKRV